MTVHVFFNDPAPTEIYTLSLHDALPIYDLVQRLNYNVINSKDVMPQLVTEHAVGCVTIRSEEHTSELQSHSDLVCRLLLEKKKRRTPAGGLVTALPRPAPAGPLLVQTRG